MGFKPFRQREQTMRRRLLCYMLVLLTVVLSALLGSLSLMGRFSNDREELTDTLELQMNFWEKELLSHSDALAARGIELSRAMAAGTEAVLEELDLSFAQLEGNDAAQTALETALLPRLRDYLLRAEASGAYVFLNTTVLPDTATHSGLYLQRSSLAPADSSLLLFRGKASVGKQYGVMPHRKWRLEAEAELFPREARPFRADSPWSRPTGTPPF